MYDTEYLIGEFGFSGYVLIDIKTGEFQRIPYCTRITYSNSCNKKSNYVIMDLYTEEIRYLNLRSVIKYPHITDIAKTNNVIIS